MKTDRFATLSDGVYAHASGALWLPSSQTAILADLHLGFAWAQRRRGELWPLTDGGARERLLEICDELAPQKLVVAGDIIHAPRPSEEEYALIESTLACLRERTELICVQGNHDRGREFIPEWRAPGQVRVLHGDVLPEPALRGELLVVGHFHPALSIEDAAGVTRVIRAFVHGNGLCVLPAFSPFATGCNLRRDMPVDLQAWFRRDPVDVVLTSGKRVLRLKPHRVRDGVLRV